MDIKVLGIDALRDGFSYVVSNPAILVKTAMNAAKLRLGLPQEALRWLVEHLVRGPRAPQDIDLQMDPPALQVGATVDVMGTRLRVSAALRVEDVRYLDGQLRLALRVGGLKVDAPKDSPAAQMLVMMDLRKPGNLMMFMPTRPKALLEARDDLFVLDLLQLGKLRGNALAANVIGAVSEVLGIREVVTEEGMLVVGLHANPLGLPAAIARLRQG